MLTIPFSFSELSGFNEDSGFDIIKAISIIPMLFWSYRNFPELEMLGDGSFSKKGFWNKMTFKSKTAVSLPTYNTDTPI